MKKSKWKRTSRSLGASILSLILCISMLAGTTFAWFTDTATNTGNRVQMGELEFDLEMYKDAAESEDGDGYVSIAGGSGDIFSEAAGTGIRWEPGKTQIVFLKVENEGNVAANYNLQIDVTDMDSEDDVDPAGVLEYAVIDQLTASEYAAMNVQDWNALKAKAQTGNLKAGVTQAATFGALLPGKDNYFVLAVHMDDAADNQYMGKTVKIGVQLTANQKRYENGDTIYLLKSDFEGDTYTERRTDGVAQGTTWVAGGNSHTREANFVSGAGDTPSGSGYMKFGYEVGDSTDGKVWAGYTFYSGRTQFLDGQEYTITTWMKYEKGSAGANVIPTIRFEFYDKAGAQIVHRISFEVDEVVEAEGEWVEVTRTFTAPASGVTGKKMRFGIWQVNAETGKLCADGIVSLDNVRIFTYEEDPVLQWAEDFKQMLAAEAAVSQKVEGSLFDEYADRTLVDGAVNLVKDGSFTNSVFNASNSSWFAREQFVSSGQYNTDSSDGQGGSLQLTYNGTNNNPWYYQDLEAITTDVVYVLSYDYKILDPNQKATPCIKIETFADPSIPGGEDSIYDQIDIVPENGYVADGEWHSVKQNFVVSENAYILRMLPRLMCNKKDGSVLIDNIQLYMTKPADMVSLNTEFKFYYAGEADMTTFSAAFLSQYFPEYSDVTADFMVYDGATLVWEKTGNAFSNDVAQVQFPLENLEKKAVPYCVKVILRDKNGQELDAVSDNIFLYDRPEYLTEEGVLVKDLDKDGTAESFDYPILGYHVNFDSTSLAKIKEAGINLVQSSQALSPDEALEQLDACYEAGIMMLLNLYPTKQPAGSSDNIVRTIRVISDERVTNHPALFGYLVMDEPFLVDQNAYMNLENSYRLIRKYDTKHPTLTAEPHIVDLKKATRYVDIIIGDFYTSGISNGVYVRTEATLEMTNGRPVYTLVKAYSFKKDDTFPTGSDVRNNMWKAILAGSKGSGYFSISDGYGLNTDDPEPVYGQEDFWNGVTTFETKEKKVAYDYFMLGKATVFNEDTTGSKYWYSSRVAEDGSIYLVVLGRQADGENAQGEIALTNTEGTVSITVGTVELIAGDSTAAATVENGKLKFSIEGVDVSLYKITPQS